ncbi:MAG: hypothetical protein R2881_05660 [Eubacteriales bacterium]
MRRHTAGWKRPTCCTNASRVCPALCEGACTCGMNGEPVSIREVERF